MTIYDVMRDGDVLLVVHERHEHIVSWDTNRTLKLWIETDGEFELLETRQYADALSLEMATASAMRVLFNIEEKARVILHEVQSLTIPRVRHR